jgi:pyruvate/2-oxoglutarate/acetoin dehydrogenase E1 component
LPATLLAHAGGIALAGLRPFVVLPSLHAAIEGLAALREVAQLAWRSGNERSAPVVILAPHGPGFGTGGDATEGAEALLAHVPGLRVVCIGQPDEAACVLRAAAAFEHGEEPTIVLLPRSLIAAEQSEQVPDELGRSLRAANIVRAGRALTVFAWGDCIELAAAAIEANAIDATLVDVVSLQPLDREALVEAARDTGKIAIVHSGPRHHGLGAELAALLADAAIYYLDAPIVRICGDDPPLGPIDEWRALPDANAVGRALLDLAAH